MQYLRDILHNHSFNSLDGTAVTVSVLSLMQWLPALSAALSCVWVALRIYILMRDQLFQKGPTNGDK